MGVAEPGVKKGSRGSIRANLTNQENMNKKGKERKENEKSRKCCNLGLSCMNHTQKTGTRRAASSENQRTVDLKQVLCFVNHAVLISCCSNPCWLRATDLNDVSLYWSFAQFPGNSPEGKTTRAKPAVAVVINV